MFSEMEEKLKKARHFLLQKGFDEAELVFVLGSGLGEWHDYDVLAKVSYREIPGFPRPTVEGHAGELVYAKRGRRKFFVMRGRFHYYEGYPMSEITFPVRVVASFGPEAILISSATGSLNPAWNPGEFVFITDHINLIGENPLRGYVGPDRFLDLSNLYDEDLRDFASRVAMKSGITVHEGIFVGMPGPTYETPAEVQMLRKLGGDVVGMSMIPEAIVSHHVGLRVLGVAFISNLASGLSNSPLTHEEVLETVEKVRPMWNSFLSNFVDEVPL